MTSVATLTLSEAAAALGRSEHVVRRWITDGDLPVVERAPRLRIAAEVVRELAQYLTVPEAAQLRCVTRETLHAHIAAGRISVRILGGRRYLRRADVRRLKLRPNRKVGRV